MGTTHVTVAIRNPAEPDRVWEGLFLVDTGAVDCLVPRPQLEAIGLVPLGQRIYGLADGSELRMDVTVARVEFMGEVAGATIVFGQAGAEPLLGVTALESVGIEVDPRNQTLNRLPSTRLKGLQPGSEALVHPERLQGTPCHRILAGAASSGQYASGQYAYQACHENRMNRTRG